MKAVIFDMDGVLVDSEPVYLGCRLRFAQERNPLVRREDLLCTVGCTSQDSWSVMAACINNGQTWQELLGIYKQTVSVHYKDIQLSSLLRPEAISVIHTLKDRGYRLAVASSNGSGIITQILEESGLFSCFDTLVSGEMFKRSKPSPEIYEHTASLLGIPPEACFVVEDSTVGITAAHEAGMTVTAIIDNRFGFDRSLADYEVNSLPDILKLL